MPVASCKSATSNEFRAWRVCFHSNIRSVRSKQEQAEDKLLEDPTKSLSATKDRMFTRHRKERILGKHKTRLMYANRAQIKVACFQTMLTRCAASLMLPYCCVSSSFQNSPIVSPLLSSTKYYNLRL